METTVKETNEVIIDFSVDGVKIINGYKKIKTLGHGSFSKVILVENIYTHNYYAAKIINKRELERQKKGFFKDENGILVVNNLLQDSLREIAILKKTNHRNIIRLHDIIHDDDAGKIYLILECCNKGSILDYDDFTGEFSINNNFKKEDINKMDYSEEEIKDFLRGIICGLEYLHVHNIIHRDIKPGNILLDDNFQAKITDFNVSAMLEGSKGDILGKKIEGTMFFMAPECCGEEIKEMAGKPLDIWALGILSYLLTYRDLPFKPDNPENIIELLDLIVKAEFKFPLSREITPGLRDIITKMLEKDPKKRITITELKNHPWINQNRTPLNQEHIPEKITVTDEEIHSSINFFVSLSLAKRCGIKWKKLLKNFDNLNIAKEEHTREIKEEH